ncbi:hypothetical protein scyTo_0018204 [Scyliorhinus torazame]|uniref:THAP-type domain-containing protein n=1 Tax=Scyliorhinus torazame TaxID=75743 RepID=A0A401PQC0_SCYTO|nr:hypothetical protein [Scyliorhinus torazame]
MTLPVLRRRVFGIGESLPELGGAELRSRVQRIYSAAVTSGGFRRRDLCLTRIPLAAGRVCADDAVVPVPPGQGSAVPVPAMADKEGDSRSCAVRGCTNTQSVLSQWREAACTQHWPQLHRECPCLEPFCFYSFPSGCDERGRWLQALRGRGLKLLSGPDPGPEAAVCSVHLEEGTLLLGLGLRKKPRADQAPPGWEAGEAECRHGRETRASRARKKQHESPRPWRSPPPPAVSGSWEQAAVQAIMRLRCSSSQRVARTLIACLKGENDHLRQRSRQLEAALEATSRQLERLQRECRCRERPGAEPGPQLESAEPLDTVPGNEVTVG